MVAMEPAFEHENARVRRQMLKGFVQEEARCKAAPDEHEVVSIGQGRGTISHGFERGRWSQLAETAHASWGGLRTRSLG